jgi:NADP-dependent 3-hydroxy acid dehydrogenase YdfG
MAGAETGPGAPASGVADKVVAITGASSGIGEAAALMLASAGAKLALGARRTDGLEGLVRRIVGAGGEAVHALTDVTRRADLLDLVALARMHYGRLDVVIANAGVAPISPLDELRVDEWDQMIDVNVKGVLYAIAAALPVFRAQGFGHFVTLASTAGFKTVPNQAVYSATKFAVRALCEGLRQEAGDKLRVTIVSPGFVATDLVQSVPEAGFRAQLLAARDRMAIPPNAVAKAILFAIEQPPEVDVNEIVIRPTAQA